MKEVLTAAKVFQDFLDHHRWEYCFIGGVALQRWAIPRNTNHVDLTLLSGIGSEEEFIGTILASLPSRVDEDQEEFFLRRRVVLVEIDGVGIDVSLGALPFEEMAVSRSSYFEFIPGVSLRTCTAEDLIVHKAFANRLKDWADIESIVEVQATLDWTYVV